MGSRARTAAATCLVAAGVWAVGIEIPMAAADLGDGSGAATEDRSGRGDRGTGALRRGRGDAESTSPRADRSRPGWKVDRPERRRILRGKDGSVGENPGQPCCDDRDDCGPGWPFPWPQPEPPGEPPSAGHGGGGGRPVGVPRPGGQSRPGVGGPASRPPPDVPFDPGVLDTIPGAALPGAGLSEPISVPVLAVPAVPVAPSGPASSSGSVLSVVPRENYAGTPPARRPAPQPAPAVDPVPGGPAKSSFRLGYGETLRGAGTSQLAALALPGVVGILILTAAGGLLGYRQAKASQAVRGRSGTRFMN